MKHPFPVLNLRRETNQDRIGTFSPNPQLTCRDFLPGGDESGLWLAEDGPHLRRPGVPGAAGECSQQRQTHPGGRVLFPKVHRHLPRTHLEQSSAFTCAQTGGSGFCSGSYLDHVEQRQLRGNSSVAEHLDPVPLTPWGGPKPLTWVWGDAPVPEDTPTFFVVCVELLLPVGAPAGQLGGGEEEGQQSGEEAEVGHRQDEAHQEGWGQTGRPPAQITTRIVRIKETSRWFFSSSSVRNVNVELCLWNYSWVTAADLEDERISLFYYHR